MNKPELAATALRLPGKALLIFLGGLVLTLVGAVLLGHSNHDQAQRSLEFEANEATDSVMERIKLYQYGLRGVRAVVLGAGEDGINRALFKQYSLTRDLHTEFPGARAFGFIRLVNPSDEAAFLASVRRDGRPAFTIKQITEPTDLRFIVQVVEPESSNKAAIGANVASEPARREALIAALKTGEVRLTAPITLLQTPDRPARSYLMLLPIYRGAVTPASEAQREALGLGWSFTPLVMEDVIRGLGNSGSSIALPLEITDTTEPQSPTLIYSAPSASALPLTYSVDEEVFGRHWRLTFSANHVFVQNLHQLSPRIILLLGGLTSLLLAAFFEVSRISRQRRRTLADQQAWLAAIVESSADAIIGKTLNGTVTSWNKGAEQLFRYPSEYAVGRALIDLIVPAQFHAEELEILRRISQGERISSFQTLRQRRDGTLVDVSVNVSPIYGEQGQIIGASKTVRDISEQQASEIQQLKLRAAKEQADAANAAKSFFLANMSHEIRTPMNAVLGMLQLVEQSDLNMRQYDYVTKAQTAARSLLGLLNDILDYSKIEAGKLQLDTQPFELETLMQDLSVVLAGNQVQEDVEIMFDIDTRLPPVLIGDNLRLQQVLINLAGNAVKFTQRGQVVVRVQLLEEQASHVQVRMAIEDTGIGISAEQLLRIFDGFTQAEASTTRRFGGTGLGLVICKRLVALMGGELQVESQPGIGSRFWFDLHLPIGPAAEPVARLPAEQRIRLLIADDNLMAGEVLQRTLAALGWQADRVAGGTAAVDQVRSAQAKGERYDVVLMDWRMPDMDGIRAAELIRQRARNSAPPIVIMITAYGREMLADLYEVGSAPFAGLLTKPVTPRQLSETVIRAFQHVDMLHPGARHPAAHSANRLAGLRLLVVEDNMINRQIAQALLSGEGAQVSLADGGIEGVRMTVESAPPFDAVLMDIQMPDIDGLEATRRIRAVPGFGQLPIIAMTANAASADRELSLAAGMNDHVGKPIDLEQLIATLLKHTGVQPSFTSIPAPTDADNARVEPYTAMLSRLGGSPELISSALSAFGPDMQQMLEHLSDANRRNEMEKIRALLHAIKGSAGTMGATALATRAAAMERRLVGSLNTPLKETVLGQAEIDELRDLLADSLEILHSRFDRP